MVEQCKSALTSIAMLPWVRLHVTACASGSTISERCVLELMIINISMCAPPHVQRIVKNYLRTLHRSRVLSFDPDVEFYNAVHQLLELSEK